MTKRKSLDKSNLEKKIQEIGDEFTERFTARRQYEKRFHKGLVACIVIFVIAALADGALDRHGAVICASLPLILMIGYGYYIEVKMQRINCPGLALNVIS